MRNTRTFTAVVAFMVTFIFSAGLVRIIFPAPQLDNVFVNQSRNIDRNTNAIEYFIFQDERNGVERMARIAGLRATDSKRYSAEYADAVMEYWKTSSSMEVSQFPQDFQDAWREHMKAWGNYADFLNEMKTPSARKNMDEADFKNAEKRFDAEISRTWYEVLRIGRNYGAKVY